MKIRSIAARLVSVAVSAVIVLTSMMIPVSAADSGIETAKEAVAEIGAGWNLGNSLESWQLAGQLRLMDSAVVGR